MKKYKILVTNDDSINYIGLKNLVKAALPYASELMVVAPHVEMSAASRKLSTKNPIILHKHEDMFENVKTYSIEGTPTDCVKFCEYVLKFDFDIVLSGVNKGYNLADDIMYSGTCAAAMEAEFLNKRGYAISTSFTNSDNYDNLKPIVDYIFNNLVETDILLYNINYPESVLEYKYILTHQGQRQVKGHYELVGEDTYKLVSFKGNIIEYNERVNDELSDFVVVNKGYISITPIINDVTYGKQN